MENPLPELWRKMRRPEPRRGHDWRWVARPERLRRHTRVQPLRTGKEAFPVMLAAIRAAQRMIHLEMYIIHDDKTGRMFRDALVERAQAGVRVRLIYDGLGSFGLPQSYLGALAKAGVEAHEYHPLAPWRPRWGINRRDHKKILVVDDRIGFVGGLNLGDEYAAVEDGGGGWFDWHVGLEGPAVYDLAVSFRDTWIHLTEEHIELPPMPAPALGANVLGCEVIENQSVRTRWRMHRSYLFAVRKAEKRIDIMMAYFIPRLSLRIVFARAARRGVQVRIVVPSASDVQAVAHASRHLHKRLIQRGVRIFEWPDRMMHAKFGVIDGAWSTIGSYNLDHRSLQHNLEISIVVVDRRLGSRLADQFDADLARCREVTLESLDRRSAWQRFLDWFWYQMRFYL